MNNLSIARNALSHLTPNHPHYHVLDRAIERLEWALTDPTSDERTFASLDLNFTLEDIGLM